MSTTRRRPLLACLFAGWLLLPAPPATAQFDKREFDNTNILVQEAVNHIYQKRYNQAFGVLKKAYGRSPNAPAVHFNLARLYELTGNFTQSLREYQMAVVLDPSMVAARRGIARVSVEQKRESVMQRTAVMEAARTASLARRQETRPATLAALPPATRPAPPDPISDFTPPTPPILAPQTPTRPPAQTTTLSTLPALPAGFEGRTAGGDEHNPYVEVPPLPPEAARPVGASPSSPEEQRAEQALERGDAKTAIPLLEQAQAADPDNPRLLWLLGRAQSQVGDLFEAIKFLEEALRIDENHLGARYLLAQDYAKVNLLDEAISNYKRYYEVKPNPKVALEIAQLSEKAGQPDQARSYYAKAQTANPASPQLQQAVDRAEIQLAQKWYLEGNEAFGRGDFAGAGDLFERALQTRTLSPAYERDAHIKRETCRLRQQEVLARQKPIQAGFAATRRIYGTLNLRYSQLLTIPFQTKFVQPVVLEWRGYIAREISAYGQRFLLMIKELGQDELDELRRDNNEYRLNPHFKGLPLFLVQAPAGGFPAFARPGQMLTVTARTDYKTYEVRNDLGQNVRLPSLEFLAGHP